MENEQSHSNPFWRRLAISLLVIAVIVVGIRLALKSDWLFDKVRDMAVEQVNQQLNGTLQIDVIRGDLLSGFTARGLSVSGPDGESIATIDSVAVSYSLMPLIRSPHTLDRLEIGGVEATLVQDEDSLWNVMQLIPPQQPDETDEEPTQWHIEQLTLMDADISLRSEHLFPDGYLNIRTLAADMTAGAGERGFYGSLRSLGFALEEARLPEPVRFFAEAEGDEERVTLESLVIQSGRTLLSSSANMDLPGQISGRLEIAPLSRDDLAAYLDDLPLQHDLRIEIGAEGSLSDLDLRLSVQAEGLQQLTATTTLNPEDDFRIRSFQLDVDQLNGPELTGLDEVPSLDSFSFRGSGTLIPEIPEQSDWNGSLQVRNMRYGDYGMDSFSADYDLSGDQLQLSGETAYGGETITFSASAGRIWSEHPSWEMDLYSREMNLATWLNQPDLDSRINLDASIRGEGISPEDLTAEYRFSMSDSRFNDQPIARLDLDGSITPQEIITRLEAELDESRMMADATVQDWQGRQQFRFDLRTESFNVADLTGMEHFPTRINTRIRGEGESFDPETMRLNASVAMDSSFVNREEIDRFTADIQLSNQILQIDDAVLESPISDARFTLRQHIADLSDPGNRLDLFTEIKDLQPLAPLFGFERLHTTGTFRGEITQSDRNVPAFSGTLDLDETFADTLFRADRVSGEIAVLLVDEPEAEVHLELTHPFIYEIGIDYSELFANATFGENETAGTLGFLLQNNDEISLEHTGDFRMDSSLVWLETHQLDLRNSLHTLSLARPFTLTFEDDVLRTDTLTIRTSERETALSLWIPHADSLTQHAGMEAENLDIGELQRLFLEDPLIAGTLSANLRVMNAPGDLQLHASGLFNHLVYEDAEMDLVRFDVSLVDEWLDAELSGHHEDRPLFGGALRIPFRPDDPAGFDDDFFDREIEGHFELHDTELDYWAGFLPEGTIEPPGGTARMIAELDGQAGNPKLTGHFELADATFSGIEINRFEMNLDYLHEEEQADITGALTARNQRVLDLDARLPFNIDLRNGQVVFPGEDDPIDAQLQTRNFDLALFNDFLDPEVARQLRGTLNGEITLGGTIGDPETGGRMELTDGSVRIVPAGITLGEIRSVVRLDSDRILLQQFSMRSGPGRIRANGYAEMDNFTPGNLQINVSGSQFRAANTTEYNALIDLAASIEGSFDEPRLTGNLTFLSGYVNLQNFGERAVEDVQLEDEEPAEPIDFYEAMAIEMNVDFARQFYIRNRQFLDMEIELGGNVDLLKDPYEELQMFGSLEGVRGYARPLGRNFELDEAVVSFFGPVDNPELNIITRYEPHQARTDVRIFYVIEGTVQDPDFRFDSEPQLELQDIISYTLFGKPFYELESWEQVVAGTGSSPTAGDIALDLLLDRVELLASQRLGIDVVQIDNTRSGSSSTTSIKTGWFLNRRTFFAILNEISSTRPKTLFMLEYLLMDNLELIITQGDDSREGIDLRWNYDY